MKLSMMMTGRSPIITLKKLLSPKTTWTVSMSSLISTTSWRLRMTGLDAAIPEMGGDNSDYDTRQMIFNNIQKQEKKKSLNLKLTIQVCPELSVYRSASKKVSMTAYSQDVPREDCTAIPSKNPASARQAQLPA